MTFKEYKALLEKDIEFLNEESTRIKYLINTKGYHKYNAIGKIMKEYRYNLKAICAEMIKDLNELEK